MHVPTLELRLLGGFELRCGHETVPIHSGRIRSLLAWMALHPDQPQPRPRVASLLWPESQEGQARTNLRNLIHQLRRAFPEIERYLDVDGSELAWLLGAPLSIDVQAFERALALARSGAADFNGLDQLERALALYRGPLLPDEYAPWLLSERERLHNAYLSGLAELRRARVEHGDDVPSSFSRQHTLAAPAGHRSMAVRNNATPPAAAPVASSASDMRETRLVGRTRQLQALQDEWERALRSGPRMVWVSGDPGIGKTRLVQAFLEWVEDSGGRAVQASGYPTLGALAYGPAIAWLRSPALQPLVAAAPPSVRAELGRLLPELDGAPARSTDSLTDAERRQRLHDAVIDVLGRAPKPLLLAIDDLHWSDQETVDLIQSIVVRCARPLLIVGTVRTGETTADHPSVRVGASLAAAGRLARIPLSPLGHDDTGTLLRDLLGDEISDAGIDALFRETEGNPLFIIETARSGRRGATDGAERCTDSMSPRMRAVIETRLGLLSAEARTVVQVASAIGREFTQALLLRASPLAEDETLRGLEEAWERTLVRERDDGSYDFSHGKIAEAAYVTTSPVSRQAYHRRIAAVLARALDEGDGDVRATLDQVALHYDGGGSATEAVRWYRRAARAAREVSALDAVRQLLGRALELHEQASPSPERDAEELAMQLGYGSVLVALEGYGRHSVIRSYTRARELCERLGRPVPPPVLRALALASLAAGDLAAGTRYGAELTRTAERDGDTVAAVEGAYTSGVMAFWKGELDLAERALRDALARYRPDRHREHVLLYAQDPKVVCLSRLSWTLWHHGRLAESLACRDEALALAGRQDDPMGLAYALWFTLFIAVEQGDLRRLGTQIEELKRTAGTHNLPYAGTVGDGFEGYLEAARGSARDGIAHMRATLDDGRWFGMEYVLKSQTLFLIARAAAGAGDLRTADATVAEALEYLGAGPSIWRAPLYQIEARVIAADDRRGSRALPAFDAATESARANGSAWTELGVAIDRGRWTLDHRDIGRRQARDNLERALATFADAPPIAAVAAGRIILDRLTRPADVQAAEDQRARRGRRPASEESRRQTGSPG
jgi:predicted ATPase